VEWGSVYDPGLLPEILRRTQPDYFFTSVEPVRERQERPELVERKPVETFRPIRIEVGEKANERQVVHVVDESEIIAEELVACTD
jgi:hypothetical protein